EAIRLFREAVALAPEDGDALGALGDLLEQKGEWRDLLPVLTARRRVLQPGRERAKTLRRLGQLWRLRLKNAANAAEAYREALNDEPDADTVTHLADVVDDPGTFGAEVAKVRARSAELKMPDLTRAGIEISA